MDKLKKKKIVKVFSDGSINFDFTIIKRSKKVTFFTKDHKNFFLNQKNTVLNNSSMLNTENFKKKYI